MCRVISRSYFISGSYFNSKICCHFTFMPINVNFTLLQSFDSVVIQAHIPLAFLSYTVNELFDTKVKPFTVAQVCLPCSCLVVWSFCCCRQTNKPRVNASQDLPQQKDVYILSQRKRTSNVSFSKTSLGSKYGENSKTKNSKRSKVHHL